MTTILVVDDSPIDRKVAGDLLKNEWYTIRLAEHGEDALTKVAEEPPDIVLADMQMPGLDGLELVQAMRKRHPSIPVILMTGVGSEETALAALDAGAASYLPKSRLARDLVQVVGVVQNSILARRAREQVRGFLRSQESTYVLGYEEGAVRALVNELQEAVLAMELCARDDLIRVGTALTEALINAIDHGNLELDSALREKSDAEYREAGARRTTTSPYRERRVYVRARLTRKEARFIVRDEGRGFDVAALPDPRDPENLNRVHGRGILLIRTFMDEVRFNERGNQVTMILKACTEED